MLYSHIEWSAEERQVGQAAEIVDEWLSRASDDRGGQARLGWSRLAGAREDDDSGKGCREKGGCQGARVQP